MDLNIVLKNSELTYEQQFSLTTQRDAANKSTKEQLVEALISTTKLLMIKDNMLKQYMNNDLSNGL